MAKPTKTGTLPASAMYVYDDTNDVFIAWDGVMTLGTVTVDSEFPPASPLSDSTLNPTTTSVGSHLMGWNPTTSFWQRITVDASGALVVSQNAEMSTYLATLAGAVSGSEMQVDVITSALPTGAATETTLAAVQTAVEIMDDWDDTNRCKVNLIAGAVGVVGGTGVDAANALRVSLATDIPLPAGTNAIGKLSANSGVDIGDVDVLTLPVVSIQPDPKSNAKSTALAASLVAKDSSGTLYEVRVTNTLASAQFIQVHNTASLPADTAVPFDIFYVGANQTVSYTPPQGLTLGTGITVCNSSTAATKTIGAADCWFSVDYT